MSSTQSTKFSHSDEEGEAVPDDEVTFADIPVERTLADEFSGFPLKTSLSQESLSDGCDTNTDPEEERMKVYLRVRPFTQYEQRKSLSQSVIEIMNENVLQVQAPKDSVTYKNNQSTTGRTQYKFSFSRIFGPTCSQKEFFDETMLGVVGAAVQGSNHLVFTYGVTNAGKTYTIQGNAKEAGILPRSLEVIFNSTRERLYDGLDLKPKYYKNVVRLDSIDEEQERLFKENVMKLASEEAMEVSSLSSSVERASQDSSSITERSSTASQNTIEGVSQIDETQDISGGVEAQESLLYSIWVSFVEVYNEYVYDLLVPMSAGQRKRQTLKLAEDNSGNTYLKGLKEINVMSSDEAYKVLAVGRKNLQMATSSLNHCSSRSHCIFSVKILRVVNKNEPHMCRVNRLSFCDLAGSERAAVTINSNDRLREACNINTSLMTLARCIHTLRYNQSHKDNPRVVPYRNSKITRMFQSFFCGKGKACMVVNISPCALYFDETIQTLKFSAIAKQVTVISVREPEPVMQKTIHIPSKVSLMLQDSTRDRTTMEWAGAETIETIVEEADAENNSAEVKRLQLLIEELTQNLIEEKRKVLTIESKVRKELCDEFAVQLTEIENQTTERILEEREMAQEYADSRIELLQKSLKKSRKRARITEEREDELISKALLDMETARLKEKEHQVSVLQQKLEESQRDSQLQIEKLKSVIKQSGLDRAKTVEENSNLQFRLSDANTTISKLQQELTSLFDKTNSTEENENEMKVLSLAAENESLKSCVEASNTRLTSLEQEHTVQMEEISQKLHDAEEEINRLKQSISNHEQQATAENKDDKGGNRPDSSNDFLHSEIINELQRQIQDAKSVLLEKEAENMELNEMLQEAGETFQEKDSNIKQLEKTIEQLKTLLNQQEERLTAQETAMNEQQILEEQTSQALQMANNKLKDKDEDIVLLRTRYGVPEDALVTDDTNKTYDQLNTTNALLEKQNTSMAEQLEGLSKQLCRYVDENEVLEKKLETALSRCRELEEQKVEMENKETCMSKIADCEKNVAVQEAVSTLESEKHNLLLHISELQNELAAGKDEIETLNSLLTESQSSAYDTNRQLTALMSQLEKMKEQAMEQLKSVEVMKEENEKLINANKTREDEYQMQAESLRNEIEELRNQLAQGGNESSQVMFEEVHMLKCQVCDLQSACTMQSDMISKANSKTECILKERDEIKLKFTELLAENDNLLQRTKLISGETQELSDNLNAVTKEREQLLKEKSELLRENNLLTVTIASLKTEGRSLLCDKENELVSLREQVHMHEKELESAKELCENYKAKADMITKEMECQKNAWIESEEKVQEKAKDIVIKLANERKAHTESKTELENVMDLVSKKDGIIKELEASLSNLNQDLAMKVENVEVTRKEIEELRSKLNAMARQKEDEISCVHEKLESSQAAEKMLTEKCVECQKQVANLENKIEEFRHSEKQFNVIEEQDKIKLGTLEKELDALKHTNENLVERDEQNEKKCLTLQIEINQLNNTIDKLKETEKQNESHSAELQKELILVRQIEQRAQQLNDDKCLALQNELDEFKQQVQILRETDEQSKTRIAELENILEASKHAAENVIAKDQENIKKCSTLEVELSNLKQKLASLKEQDEQSKKQVVELQNELFVLKEREKSFILEGEQSKEKISELTRQLEELKQNEQNLVESAEQAKNHLREVNEKNLELSNLKQKLANLEEQDEQSKKQIVKLQNELCVLKEREKSFILEGEQSKEKISELTRRLEELEQNEQSLFESTEQAKKQLREANEKNEAELGFLQKQLETLKYANDELIEKKSDVSKLNERLKLEEEKISELKQTVRDLEEEVKRKDIKINNKVMAIADLKNENESKTIKRDLLTKDVAEQAELISQLKMLATEQESTMEIQDKALKDKENEVTILQNDMKKLADDYEQKLRKITEEKKSSSQLASALEESNKELKELERLYAESQKQLETLKLEQDSHMEAKTSSLQEQVASKQKEIDSLSRELRIKERQKEKLCEENKEKDVKMQKWKEERNEIVGKLETVLKAHSADLRTKTAKIQELEDLLNSGDQVNVLKQQISESEVTIANLKSKSQLQLEKIDHLEKQLSVKEKAVASSHTPMTRSRKTRHALQVVEDVGDVDSKKEDATLSQQLMEKGKVVENLKIESQHQAETIARLEAELSEKANALAASCTPVTRGRRTRHALKLAEDDDSVDVLRKELEKEREKVATLRKQVSASLRNENDLRGANSQLQSQVMQLEENVKDYFASDNVQEETEPRLQIDVTPAQAKTSATKSRSRRKQMTEEGENNADEVFEVFGQKPIRSSKRTALSKIGHIVNNNSPITKAKRLITVAVSAVSPEKDKTLSTEFMQPQVPLPHSEKKKRKLFKTDISAPLEMSPMVFAANSSESASAQTDPHEIVLKKLRMRRK